MRRLTIPLLLAPVLVAGCAGQPEKGTLAELRNVQPDVQEAPVEQGLDQAMQGYRRFLEETPETAMTPEAMRRLADLQVEKQFGIRAGDGKPREMAAPEPAQGSVNAPAESRAAAAGAGLPESEQDFEQRTTAQAGILHSGDVSTSLQDIAHGAPDPAGPLEAIALYDRLLAEYPTYEHNDMVLYQKARAYDELGRT
ncbi:MAG: hypothetical protein WBO00_11730, partial [Steroidobacteraceae bacterium]